MIYYKKKSWIKKISIKINKQGRKKTAPCFSADKFLKRAVYIFSSLLLIAYLSYLFLLPVFFNENNVENVVNNYLAKNSKLTLDAVNLKIYPNFKFDINLRADSIKLKYPNKTDFIAFDKPSVDVNLLNLLFGYIDLNKIKAKKIKITTNFTTANRYSCFDYFDLDILDLKSHNSKFKLRNIRFITDELLFTLYDENIKKSFYMKSSKVKISSSDFEKPVEVTAKGTISSATHKISDFDLMLLFKTNPNSLNKFKDIVTKLNYNPLKDADKFKFYSKTDIDLKILPTNEKDKKIAMDGKINIKDYTFVLNNTKLPQNNLLILFKGDRISTDCDFKLVKEQFIKIKSSASFSKYKFIEAKLTSNDINLSDLGDILGALSKIFNLKINPDEIALSGFMSADLYLKSNFKTVNSNGELSIKDAKLNHKKTGLNLHDINSDISFSDNKINIKNTSAYVDKAKFYLNGTIDNKTNLDLKINSDLMNIAQVVNLAKAIPLISGTIPSLDNYVFNSGMLKINAIAKGTFNKPLIQSNSKLVDFKISTKSPKTRFQSKEILISAYPETLASGTLNIIANNSYFTFQNTHAKIPSIKLNISNNDIVIPKTALSVEGTEAFVQGNVKNYKNKNQSELHLSFEGNLPKNNKLFVIKNKNAQAKANVLMKHNKLVITDCAILDQKEKIMSINGIINNPLDKNSAFSNLRVVLNKKTGFILPQHQNLSFDASGSILANGSTKNPDVSGNLNLSNVNYKNLNMFIKDMVLNVKNSTIYVNIVNGTLFDFNFDLVAQGKFANNKLTLDFANLSSKYVKLDNFERFMKNVNSSNKIDYEIHSLKGNIAVVEAMGAVLNSLYFEGKIKNNILNISKFSADLFNGNAHGNLDIDLATCKTRAEIILKEINVRLLSHEFKELSIAASGKLSALINAEFTGFEYDKLIKSLNSYVKFNINDGELAQFAKLERFLQAGNILSQSILKLTLNSAISAVTKQNTGDFKTIEGTVKIKDAIANIQYIRTQGSNMSLYITGKFNLTNQNANVKILGRIPHSIVSVLGNIGKFSTGSLIDKMPEDAKEVIKSITASPIEKIMTVKLTRSELNKIPPLAYQNENTITREFIVFVDGVVKNNSSVRYFKWNSKTE